MGGGDEKQQVGDHGRKQQVGDSSHSGHVMVIMEVFSVEVVKVQGAKEEEVDVEKVLTE